MKREYDIVVIGGGHAGAEAAWAATNRGALVALVTLDPSRIAQLSCNPSIGGLAKGQMVREIDALGGLMGIATDNTAIQLRMLNRGKGPAVWGLRSQSDKSRYAAGVQRLLFARANLDIMRGEAVEILVAGQPPAVRGVALDGGCALRCRAVIVTTGTFLRALMHTGQTITEGGRVGEASARGLSGCLSRLGLELGRLKTGTPPRLHRDSIDFSGLKVQNGDEHPMPFSYLNEYGQDRRWRPPLQQVPCHLSATNEQIHRIIRDNLHRAPMYSGQIQSMGPRYCPSIEDKIVRFADKTGHPVFLEPQGLDTDEIYCNGISTSLPADVQERIVRLVPGLEKARFVKYGYAVEYDMVWPTQIRATLQTKRIAGLFLAGQINGTSGYEEAAAQGLVAGINAAHYAAGDRSDFVLRRDQAYIGVMIDDLVIKPPTEPYRMFTSRAEHRLHLRNDNADVRLTEIGRQMGLVSDVRWAGFEAMRAAVEAGFDLLRQNRIEGTNALEWLRRSQTDWAGLCQLLPGALAIAPDIAARIEINVKYEGYIARQDRQIERFAQMENKRIPDGVDFGAVTGLRNEAKAKFAQFTPRSLGQALRISGITPADVTVLAIHLDRSSTRSAMGS